MSLESFKSFVREKPDLLKYVKNNEMTWQKFYDMFELYGPNHSIWNNYLGITSNGSSFKDMFNTIKKMDMTEVQKGIDSLQKGITYIQDLVKNRSNVNNIGNFRENSYERKPIYKHLDD